MRRWSRRVVIFIGVLCIAVGIGLAMSWEEAAIRYQLHRLRTEPGYLQEVVIERVAQEHAWAPALGSDANYIVEFVEYDTRPRHTLAWAAIRELMKSEQGRKAVVQALESAEFEKAVMGMVLPKELIDAYSRAAGSGLIPAVERKFPVVHELDLRDGKRVPLCLGRRSVASQDGKRILIQGIGFDWLLYEVATRRLEARKLPGLHDRDRLGVYEGGVIALLEGELAIYWALPTTGASQRTTKNNSPLVGKKKMPCIKAARLSSGEFQTIIPHMDPRHEVVFGPTTAAR